MELQITMDEEGVGELEGDFWFKRMDRHTRRRARAAAKRKEGKPSFDVVCRFWLTDKCQMGDACSFLHKYIPDKIPICAYIDSKCVLGAACVFRHTYNPGERQHRPFADASRTHNNSTTVVANSSHARFAT